MDRGTYLKFGVFLCLILGGDSYLEPSSVLVDSLARDLSTNFNPLLRHHAVWYVHWLSWIYLFLATASLENNKNGRIQRVR